MIFFLLVAAALASPYKFLFTEQPDYIEQEYLNRCSYLNGTFYKLQYVSDQLFRRQIYTQGCQEFLSETTESLTSNQRYDFFNDDMLAEALMGSLYGCYPIEFETKNRLYPRGCFNQQQYLYNRQTNSIELFHYDDARCTTGETLVAGKSKRCGCNTENDAYYFLYCND